MAQGRCVGCGHIGSSAQVGIHVLTCLEYLALYRTSPENCLDPETAYQRHRQETSQARAERRDQRLGRYEAIDRQHELEAARWKTPADILED